MKSALREPSIGYIIDLYSSFDKNENVISTFKIYGVTYCVREVNKFEWGQPVFPEKRIENDYDWYYVYDSLEKAQEYVKYLRRIEGSRL